MGTSCQNIRMPSYSNCEKFLLRQVFNDDSYLPDMIVYLERKKHLVMVFQVKKILGSILLTTKIDKIISDDEFETEFKW